MSKLTTGLLLLALGLAARPAWPQVDPSQSQGNAAAGTTQAPGQTSAQGSNPAEGSPAEAPIPDKRPLNGAEDFTLGLLAPEHSYFLPGLTVAQTVDTNAQLTPGRAVSATSTVLLGRLALVRVGERNEFRAAYQGGTLIFETQLSPGASSNFQDFGFTDTLTLRRWTLQLNDRLSYLPESSFGFGGLSLVGAYSFEAQGTNLGTPLATLSPGFVPDQSILAGRQQRFSNVFLGQAQYSISPRSSFTAVGAYQYLQSSQSGFISGNNTLIQAGYERSLTPQDSLGFIYDLSLFRFVGLQQSMDAHFAGLTYGRRVTGRLAFRATLGPEIVRITTPIVIRTQTYGSGLAQLTFAQGRATYGLTLRRSVTGGGGLLPGAVSTTLSGEVTRQLTRRWFGTISGGYARNNRLVQTTSAVDQVFNYEFGNLRLDRQLGRYTRVFASYSFQTQNSNFIFSVGSVVGRSLVRHIFGIGIDFNYRPLGI